MLLNCVKILRVTLIIVTVLTWGNLISQTAFPHFLLDQDYSGTRVDPNFDQVQAKADEVASQLPDIYQPSFKVVDGGAYYIDSYSSGTPVGKFDSRFDELKSDYLALLFIGKLIKESGDFEFYVRIKLELDDQYSCLTESSISSLEQQVSGKMNQLGSRDFVLGEVVGIEAFLSQVLSVTECCQVENKDGDPTLCEACTLETSIYDDSGIDELENIILNEGNYSDQGKFIPLRNTQVAFNGLRYSPLYQRDVPILMATLKSHNIEGDFDVVGGLEELKQSAIDFGRGDDVRLDIRYYNDANCNQLTTFLRDSEEGNRSYEDGYSEYLYDEQLIVLHISGEVRLYSRIFSKFPEAYLSSSKNGGDEKSLIIPALIAREVIKRAAMGAVNVFIELGVSVVIEKIFGAPLDCGEDDCSQDTWGDAWARYKVEEFSNARYAVWKILILFAEGAIDPPVIFEIISAGLQPALKYLFTGMVPPGYDFTISSSGDGEAVGLKSTNFDFSKFFGIFIKEATTAAATQGIFRWGGKAVKAIKNVRGPTFPSSQLASDCNFSLLWKLFLDPDRVGAYGKISTLPPVLRKRVENLDAVNRLDDLVLHQDPIRADKLIRQVIEGVDQLGARSDYVLNKINSEEFIGISGYRELVKAIKKVPDSNSSVANEVHQTFKHLDGTSVPNNQKVLGHKSDDPIFDIDYGEVSLSNPNLYDKAYQFKTTDRPTSVHNKLKMPLLNKQLTNANATEKILQIEIRSGSIVDVESGTYFAQRLQAARSVIPGFKLIITDIEGIILKTY